MLAIELGRFEATPPRLLKAGRCVWIAIIFYQENDKVSQEKK